MQILLNTHTTQVFTSDTRHIEVVVMRKNAHEVLAVTNVHGKVREVFNGTTSNVLEHAEQQIGFYDINI